MPVGRHHGDVFRGDVEVDTVHHGTEFIICRGKQGAVDTTQHNRSGNVYPNGIVGQSHRARIFIGILAHEAVFTVGVLNQDLESICVDLERKRLFGQFLQRIEQGLRSHGKRAVRIAFNDLDGGIHGCFAIGYGNGQCSVFKPEQKTIKNGQRVF
ncbi:hypothetical protein SDC9_186875 [bioreactor metagenome]|uniref:Uncharacterized protein n=1 Tax=bioreactor metagenome TaxID=1076179 RepID=A0A645HK35_9ZZZZ